MTGQIPTKWKYDLASVIDNLDHHTPIQTGSTIIPLFLLLVWQLSGTDD